MAVGLSTTTFTSAGDATTTTGNLSLAVASGLSLLVVQVAVRRSATAATSIVSVVWNGNALTLVSGSSKTNTTSRTTVETWYLASPTAATGNLVVTWTSGHLCSYGIDAIAVTGTSNTPANGTGSNGSAASASVNVTSASGLVVIDMLATNNGRTLTPDASQTALYATFDPVGTSGLSVRSSKETAAGASTTMSWTIATSTNYAQSACTLEPAAAVVSGGNFFAVF